MKIDYRLFHGPSDWGWVQQQVGILRCEDTTGIMAIDPETNETVGACILDNWLENSVQGHFIMTDSRVAKNGALEFCFDYIFNNCGKKRIYGFMAGDNLKGLKFSEYLGFEVKARFDEGFKDGVDYLLLELKRENCKFIGQDEKVADYG